MSTEKNVLKDAMIYTILGFFPMAVNFLVLPLYTSQLQPEEYAIITLLSVFQALTSVIPAAIISTSFSRKIVDFYKDENALSSFISTTLISILILGAVIICILFFIGESIFNLIYINIKINFNTYGIYSILIMILGILNTTILSYYRFLETIKKYSFYSLLFFLFPFIYMCYEVFYLHTGALGILRGKTIGSSISLLFFIVPFYVKYPLKFNYSVAKWMFIFGLPFIPNFLFRTIYGHVDKIIIEKFVTPTELGIFGFALIFTTILEVLYQALNNTMTPKLFKELKDGVNLEYINKSYNMISSFVLLISIMVLCFSEQLILCFTNVKYHSASEYASLLILAYIPRLFGVIYGPTIVYFGLSNKNSFITGISLTVSVLLLFLLLPIIGIYGAIISIFASHSCQAILNYFAVTRYDSRMKIVLKNSKLILTASVIGIICLVLFSLRYWLKVHINSLWLFTAIPISIFILKEHLLFFKEFKA